MVQGRTAPFSLVIAVALSVPAPSWANQTDDVIVVTAPRSSLRAQGPVLLIDREKLDERAPVAIADVFRSVPGTSFRVNSRGEGVIRIRGSEERQTAVFLDGAPIAIPWDGRVDLGLVPAGLIDSVRIVRGAAPLEYGANSIGGVVDMSTIAPVREARGRAEGFVGTLGQVGASMAGGAPLAGGIYFVGGAGIMSRDAERMADPGAIPFDHGADRRRSNTDSRSVSLFGALGHDSGDDSVRLSLLHNRSSRGIAFQGDIDPALGKPRYWRYPDWAFDQLTLSGRTRISDDWSARATLWQQWFGQTIDAYRTARFDTLASREVDADSTQGGRAVLTFRKGGSELRLSAMTQRTTHRQHDDTFSQSSQASTAGPLLRYRQNTHSVGAEMDRRLSASVKATLGTGLDWSDNPLTGDKPGQPGKSAANIFGAVRWDPSTAIEATASLGLRSRFPSLRELFGEALGRFLANPDLRPERALLGDIAVRWKPADAILVDATLWAADNERTISQRVVRTGGTTRRQRYNMAGNMSYGAELMSTLHIHSSLSAEIGGSIQHGRAHREADGSRPELLQRAAYQYSAALDWRPVASLDLRAELVGAGASRDMADNGAIVRLPGYDAINLRAFWQVGNAASRPVTLFASIDNLTDALILPQSGLPAPGRSIRFGVRHALP